RRRAQQRAGYDDALAADRRTRKLGALPELQVAFRRVVEIADLLGAAFDAQLLHEVGGHAAVRIAVDVLAPGTAAAVRVARFGLVEVHALDLAELRQLVEARPLEQRERIR